MIFSYEKSDLSLMPKRSADSHKGTFGRVLCIVGSSGMCGAAYLSAKAAYRTGAGLVEILTHRDNLIPLQTSLPEAIVTVYGEDIDLHAVSDAVDRADVIVMGCGLGRSPLSRRLVAHVLRYTDKPRVIDADALNIISENPTLKKYLTGAIITPHVLEMSRLSVLSTEDILKAPESTALEFAKSSGAVCVLKKHRTVVSDGGERIYLNVSGNSGMATGGSGDVLAGIIGGILAQNKGGSLTLMEAASLGVYIHGLCGDTAAKNLGEYSLMASDIINALPICLK